MTTLLVHEWIAKSGGSEKVLDAMVEAFPDCQIRALWNDAPDRYSVPVTETWLSRTALRRSKSLSVPFTLAIWPCQTVNFLPERIIISSHLFAHQAQFPKFLDVPRYAYIHTPARYIWTPELDPRGKNPVVKLTSPLFRRVDRKRAQGSHAIAANSEFVRKRIGMAWERDASVIYPPVDVTEILSVNDWRDRLSPEDQKTIASLPSEFILGASRLIEYKALDQVLTFAASIGLPAVIGGDGPERAKLEDQARTLNIPTYFLGRISTTLLYALYQQATAYVFPPIEDFGIMPVEAMAAGARVIVNSVGGAAESVQHGTSGVQTPVFEGDDAKTALDLVQSIDRATARARALTFDKERFITELYAWTK